MAKFVKGDMVRIFPQEKGKTGTYKVFECEKRNDGNYYTLGFFWSKTPERNMVYKEENLKKIEL